jgi:exonuclease III
MPTITTWNILHGGGAKRIPAIALQLVECAADVLVLTEFRTTVGGQLRGVLADHGWRHQACSDPGARRNGLLIASRVPLISAPVLGDDTDRLVLSVTIPELDLGVCGLHIPCTPGSTERNSCWKRVLRIAAENADSPFALVGDFNTGRHRLDEDGATFGQTASMGRLSAMGYVDAWRTRNGRKREPSWVSHQGAGFRIDHAFVSAPLAARLEDAWYSHSERQTGLSDHSSMTVRLSEKAPVGVITRELGAMRDRASAQL